MASKDENKVEVISQSIEVRLDGIEERLASIEAMDAFMFKDNLMDLVIAAVGQSKNRRELLAFLEQPRTINEIRENFDWSPQTTSNNVNPLRENALIRVVPGVSPKKYEWAKLLTRLPQTARNDLLKMLSSTANGKKKD